jgi:hypothetical protein
MSQNAHREPEPPSQTTRRSPEKENFAQPPRFRETPAEGMIPQRALWSARQGEILESHKSDIRVKLMNATQQTIVSRIPALEAFERDSSVRQIASAGDLVPLKRSDKEIEDGQ